MKGGDLFKLWVKGTVNLSQINQFNVVMAMVAQVYPVFFFLITEKILLHLVIIVFAKHTSHPFDLPFMGAEAAF
jgi:hypothetical protein